MRSSDGKSQCEQCNGKGCFRCGRRGFFVQCPGCGNDGEETISKSEDEFACRVCGTVFDKAGTVIRNVFDEVVPVKKKHPQQGQAIRKKPKRKDSNNFSDFDQ